MDITSVFGTEVPGSNPGEGNLAVRSGTSPGRPGFIPGRIRLGAFVITFCPESLRIIQEKIYADPKNN